MKSQLIAHSGSSPSLPPMARDASGLPPAFWRLIEIAEQAGLIAPADEPGKPELENSVARMLDELCFSATEFYLLVTLFHAAPHPVSLETLARATRAEAESLGIALERLHADQAIAAAVAEELDAPVTLTPSGKSLVLLLVHRAFRSGFPGVGPSAGSLRTTFEESSSQPPFMKKIILSSRILLGLMFVVSGLNGFLHFIRLPPHSGVAGQFMAALFASKYALAVYALQALAGGLLLMNRFSLLALAILAPILANIAFFHAFMEPRGAGAGVCGIALWAVLAFRERAAFAPLWSARGFA